MKNNKENKIECECKCQEFKPLLCNCKCHIPKQEEKEIKMEDCQVCGFYICICPFKEFFTHTKDVEEKSNKWEKKFDILYDSFCEPNVTKTDKHPNCEYIFSCEEMEKFNKDLKSFISHQKQEWKENLIKEIKAKGLHLGYKNDIINIINNQ